MAFSISIFDKKCFEEENMKKKVKSKFIRYLHIPILTTMKPTPRILLGKKLVWQIKEDGECVSIWMKDGKPHISSHNLENASKEIVERVINSEDYPKILELLKENPNFVCYVEECPKGRSITGIKVYPRTTLILFDILDLTTMKFLHYILVHQHAFHYGIPTVKVYAETRHRTMKDLLKFKNHVLEYCEEHYECLDCGKTW
jgi:hypothetical protein